MARRSKSHSISMIDPLWEQIEEEAATTGRSTSAVITGIISTFFRNKLTRRSAWDTDEDDWYDPNKFYTFSQDKFGHSAKIDVTIPKHVAGEMRGIVDSGRVPELRTTQDFLRNAIRHETYRLAKMIDDDGLTEAVHAWTLGDSIAHEQAVTTETQKLIVAVSDLLDEAITLGHISYAEEQLKDCWKAATTISERFRGVYMETLRDYGKKIKQIRAEEEEKAKETARGTRTYSDGSRYKNGIELAPKRKRRNPSI